MHQRTGPADAGHPRDSRCRPARRCRPGRGQPYCPPAAHARPAAQVIDPLPRSLYGSDVNPVRAPVPAGLPDGTPHTDQWLAARGWQARGGVYRRLPQAEAEAG
jgi:hypothetical protein